MIDEVALGGAIGKAYELLPGTVRGREVVTVSS